MDKFCFIVAIFLLSFTNRGINNDTQTSQGASKIVLFNNDTSLYFLKIDMVNEFVKNHISSDNGDRDFLKFYQSRNFRYAWINEDGLNEQAGSFMNMINLEGSIKNAGRSFYNDSLHILFNLLSVEDYKFSPTDNNTIELEMMLTLNFFEYAARNWNSASEDYLKKADWFIERKKTDYVSLLDTILKSGDKPVSAFEPVFRQYNLLMKYLQKYSSIEKSGEWSKWPDEIKNITIGDTGYFIPEIKKQLFITGDLKISDSSRLFDETLRTAVEKFQHRYGLKEDGIIASKTLKAMKASIHERISRIMINMERCRWVPPYISGDYIAINIPDFKLLVFNNGKLEWSCKVVVGKASTGTVIFNGDIEYIVFSPYWDIPKSILENEILPGIKNDQDYLEKHDMEVVDKKGNIIDPSIIEWENFTGNDFPYLIRQRPGYNNALGYVKFLFPNSYGIYLHDTPEKSLFEAPQRTFSHGCIRIEKPFKLCEYLLRNDSSWTTDSILNVMYGGKETFVKLKNKIPVYITYFTSWVDGNGILNFREDVYKHDEKMMGNLFLGIDY